MKHDQQLEQFLREEVRDRSYADLLLSRTITAGVGDKVPGAGGNAYYVGFSAGEIVIEHNYLENWPALHLSRPNFITALMAWRKTLAE